MRGNIFITGLTFGIIALLTSTAVLPALSGSQPQPIIETNRLSAASSQTTTTLTFYMAGKTRLDKHTVTLTVHDAEAINTQFQTLRAELITHPSKIKTQQLEQQFLNILYEKNAVPSGVTRQELLSLLQPPTHSYTPPVKHPLTQYNFDGTEYMCTFLSWGEGTSGPIIILPRLIPIIELPIPRIYMHWTATDYAVTSCGALNSNKGFTAEGPQKGTAIGFWGIGFTVHFPPLANMYGLIGYALYAHVSADYMEYYPPNSPPEITQTDPADGQQNVPLTTSELRFQLSDADGDLMSYNVSTSPDIGSGSGGLKPDGTYSIPISGLQELTNYTWHITVTDGKDTIEKTQTFTTEAVSPIVSHPAPFNGEREVPTDIATLQFTLRDPQNDHMSYTVQTSPNIGSTSGTDFTGGTVTVPVSGLIFGTLYHWYINATDGTHWTRKVLSFTSGYPSHFNPFDYGWQYRKQVTIQHTEVAGTLTNFTILISITDSDLTKAQNNGGDLLFMDNTGSAVKLHHEIESFDKSSGALIAWIKIPLLSSSEDTVFYLYYGNPTSIDLSYPQKTWDSHYQAVWHMNDTTDLTISDSTINGYTGTKSGQGDPKEEDGKIGKGQSFDGSNDYISITDHSVLGTGDKTISFWMKINDNSDFQTLMTNALGGTYNNAGLEIAVDYGMNMTDSIGNGDSPGAFLIVCYKHIPDYTMYHYYTVRQSGSNLSLYLDGSLYGWTTTTSGTESSPNYDLIIGKSHQDPSHSYWFDGHADEIKMSNIALPASWIQTEYNNQDSPSTFLMVGPEVQGP